MSTPETIQAVKDAVRERWGPNAAGKDDQFWECAIDAADKARGLKEERMDWVADGGSIPQQRLISDWHDARDRDQFDQQYREHRSEQRDRCACGCRPVTAQDQLEHLDHTMEDLITDQDELGDDTL